MSVPSFVQGQSRERHITLSGCPCTAGISGNWYFYPESQRQMTGLGSLNSPLFVVPGVNIAVTPLRAGMLVGGVLLVRWMMSP